MYVIGIDLGTSGTKTVLFDTMGKVIASKTVEYPMYQPQNGWAEQEPLDWWNATVTGIKGVIAGIDPSEIVSIGLSGQMHGLVMLDENNKVLRKSIIWCDQRTTKECEEIESKIGKARLIEITANPALTGFTASKILWVRNNEPEIWEKCAHILLPKDYVRFMLTNEYATEVSDASGMQLLDVKNRCWSKEVLEKLEIPEAMLGKMYESPEVTGHITKEIAELTGLKEGTIVVGGAGDNAAAAVGMGVVENGKAFTTIGTSGVVFMHTDEPLIDSKGRVHTFCCAVPGKWHVMGVTQGAGLSLKWFRDNFCEEIKLRAEKEGVDPYYIMDKMAEESPIGAERLLFLPYLMGERTPHLDADCRGVFFGISGMHQKKDFIRAVMEGVTYSLKDCMLILNELGVDAPLVIASGGGAASDLWLQIQADILNKDVCVCNEKEQACLGACILAGEAVGIFSSLEEGGDRFVQMNDKIYVPNPANRAVYDERFATYQELYQRTKDLM